MRRWTLVAAAAALLAAALWHLPATAQRATSPAAAQTSAAQPAPPSAAPSPPAAPELITFDQYRDFRSNDLVQRRARLAQELSAPELTEAQKTSLERRKTYYDRLAAMSAEDRDRLFRARFDKIDTNHDSALDSAERAAWREKQREYYRQLAAKRTRATISAPPSGKAAPSAK